VKIIHHLEESIDHQNQETGSEKECQVRSSLTPEEIWDKSKAIGVTTYDF